MHSVLALILLLASIISVHADELALLPLAASGSVAPPSGCSPWSGTSTQTNPATPGDKICLSTPDRILNTDYYGPTQLSGVQANNCYTGNSEFTQNPTGATGCAATAIYCNTQTNSGSTGIASFAQPVGLGLTHYYIAYHGPGAWVNVHALDGTADCTPLFNYFLVAHNGVTGSFSDATTALLSAVTGDTLTFRSAPAAVNAVGGWIWPGQMNITTPGLTINLVGYGDSPAFFSSAPQIEHPPGVGSVLIQAANTTIDGKGTGYANGGTYQGNVWKIYNGASNPTINGATIEDFGDGYTGLLAGHNLGTVKVSNTTVQRGGIDSGGNGNYHLYYFGIDPGVSPTWIGDTAETLQLSDNFALNMISYAPGEAGIPLKMRPMGTAVNPNRVTRNMIGCTTKASLGPGVPCGTNGVIDMPCGGFFNSSYNTYERPPNADNWFIVRAMEDIVGDLNCPNNAATTSDNHFTFDHDIFIWDGQPQPQTSGFNTPVLMCLGNGAQPSGQCGTSFANPPLVPPSWDMTNSVIVGDPNFAMIIPGSYAAPGIGCALVNGACTDAKNNRWYRSRALAAAAEHWAPMDAWGNVGPEFPYLVAHM